VVPDVLYPSLDVSKFDLPDDEKSVTKEFGKNINFLSINRYERKKNLGLAIRAFGTLEKDIL
jgi:alpha-1,3/alpha-1,6-mannosyltransferase